VKIGGSEPIVFHSRQSARQSGTGTLLRTSSARFSVRFSVLRLKEQMGQSSIQVTVDICAHLIPSANVSFVDRLDEAVKQEEKTTSQQNATCEKQGGCDSPGSC